LRIESPAPSSFLRIKSEFRVALATLRLAGNEREKQQGGDQSSRESH
jgi:hypothetical protein